MEKMEGVRSLPEGVTSTINVLIDRALSGTSMVKSAEGILTLLRKEQVLLQLRLTPKMVGVHPRNRDGVGVAVREAHSLLADILDTGFVPSLVSALAFEVTGPEELEFNRKADRVCGWPARSCRCGTDEVFVCVRLTHQLRPPALCGLS